MRRIGNLLFSKKVVTLMSVLLFFLGIILKSQATQMNKRYRRSSIQNLAFTSTAPEPRSYSEINGDRETTSDIEYTDSYDSSNEGENPRNYTEDGESERNGPPEEKGTLASTVVKTMELAASQPEIYRYSDTPQPSSGHKRNDDIDESASDTTQQPYSEMDKSLTKHKSTHPSELMEATAEGPELVTNPLTPFKAEPGSTIIYEKETIRVENTKSTDRELSPEEVKAEAKIKLGELCNQDKYYVCGMNADCRQVGHSTDFVCVCMEGFEQPQDGITDCVKADKELIMASSNGEASGDHSGDISRIEEIASVTSASSDYVQVNRTADLLLPGHGEDCEPADDIQKAVKGLICVQNADCVWVNTLFKTYGMCQCRGGFLNTSKGKCISKKLIEEKSTTSNGSGKAIGALPKTTGWMLLFQMCLLSQFHLISNLNA